MITRDGPSHDASNSLAPVRVAAPRHDQRDSKANGLSGSKRKDDGEPGNLRPPVVIVGWNPRLMRIRASTAYKFYLHFQSTSGKKANLKPNHPSIFTVKISLQSTQRIVRKPSISETLDFRCLTCLIFVSNDAVSMFFPSEKI